MARGAGFEPARPHGHRLSRPAPYQARATPHAHLTCFTIPKLTYALLFKLMVDLSFTIVLIIGEKFAGGVQNQIPVKKKA